MCILCSALREDQQVALRQHIKKGDIRQKLLLLGYPNYIQIPCKILSEEDLIWDKEDR